MATKYPSNFPVVLLDGFSINVNMGIIRAERAEYQQQRRVFTTMPHAFALSFAMSLPMWAQWQGWVRANGYRWFEMDLPSMYSGIEGSRLTPHLIRFDTPPQIVNITEDDVRITIGAQLAPSMIAKYLAVT